MPFCSNCGTQVNAGDKFCNNCGNPLQPSAPTRQQAPPPPPPPPVQQQAPPQPTYQQPPQPTGEQILGVIEQCKHGFPVNTFTLFITPQRIIVAKTGGLGANFTAAGAASGGIVGGLIGAGLDARSQGGMTKKTLEYYSLTPDQMIAKDKKNFQMHLASIQSVEMKPPGFIGQGEIKFKVAGKDQKFMLDISKDDFNTHIPLLTQVLPGRVFVK